jgi:hypothetical protein
MRDLVNASSATHRSSDTGSGQPHDAGRRHDHGECHHGRGEADDRVRQDP